MTTSNKASGSAPQDPDAKIVEDEGPASQRVVAHEGRCTVLTSLTGAILSSMTVQDAVGGRPGDAAEDADDGGRCRVSSAVQPDGIRASLEVIADTGSHHSDETLVALDRRLGSMQLRCRERGTGVVAAGRTRRRARRRRRSVLRSRALYGEPASYSRRRGVVVYNGG